MHSFACAVRLPQVATAVERAHSHNIHCREPSAHQHPQSNVRYQPMRSVSPIGESSAVKCFAKPEPVWLSSPTLDDDDDPAIRLQYQALVQEAEHEWMVQTNFEESGEIGTETSDAVSSAVRAPDRVEPAPTHAKLSGTRNRSRSQTSMKSPATPVRRRAVTTSTRPLARHSTDVADSHLRAHARLSPRHAKRLGNYHTVDADAKGVLTGTAHDPAAAAAIRRTASFRQRRLQAQLTPQDWMYLPLDRRGFWETFSDFTTLTTSGAYCDDCSLVPASLVQMRF